jgi:hypothetical protein
MSSSVDCTINIHLKKDFLFQKLPVVIPVDVSIFFVEISVKICSAWPFGMTTPGQHGDGLCHHGDGLHSVFEKRILVIMARRGDNLAPSSPDMNPCDSCVGLHEGCCVLANACQPSGAQGHHQEGVPGHPFLHDNFLTDMVGWPFTWKVIP